MTLPFKIETCNKNQTILSWHKNHTHGFRPQVGDFAWIKSNSRSHYSELHCLIFLFCNTCDSSVTAINIHENVAESSSRTKFIFLDRVWMKNWGISTICLVPVFSPPRWAVPRDPRKTCQRQAPPLMLEVCLALMA